MVVERWTAVRLATDKPGSRRTQSFGAWLFFFFLFFSSFPLSLLGFATWPGFVSHRGGLRTLAVLFAGRGSPC